MSFELAGDLRKRKRYGGELTVLYRRGGFNLSLLEVVFKCMDDHLLGFYSLLHVWSDILENNEYS